MSETRHCRSCLVEAALENKRQRPRFGWASPYIHLSYAGWQRPGDSVVRTGQPIRRVQGNEFSCRGVALLSTFAQSLQTEGTGGFCLGGSGLRNTVRVWWKLLSSK